MGFCEVAWDASDRKPYWFWVELHNVLLFRDSAKLGIDILVLEEGEFVQGNWHPVQQLNGDEAVMNTYDGPVMLRVKLLAYQ